MSIRNLKSYTKNLRNSLKRKLNRLKSNFLRNKWPNLVDWIVRQANKKAACSIKSQGISVLVDTQIFFHAITHETAQIVTGTSMWGETFYTARVPIHEEGINHRDYKSIRFLPSIASLAKQGAIQLSTSDELMDEQFDQPIHRYRPAGLADYSLFKGVSLHKIKDPDYSFDCGDWLNQGPTAKEQRKNRLANKTDPLYLALLRVLGKRNSQDIWHIVTAERNGCYCFMTMDYSLIKNVNAQSNNQHVKSLKTKVLTPEQFGNEFKLSTFSPKIFSYHDANWPVRADLYFENSKRPKNNLGRK